MASCKDCLSYDVCQFHIDEETKMTINECDHFKDRNRFVELPCKVGNTVYLKLDGIAEIIEGYVRKISFSRKNEIVICIGRKQGTYYTTGNFKLSSFGKTVFLTRELAEKALKECENNG